MKQISLELLGQLVRQKRKEREWTKIRLSELTQINRQLIAKIEDGAFVPSVPQLTTLCNVLNIDTNDLLVEASPKNVFAAMMGSAKTLEEQDGFEKMISMMLCIRKHERLRRIAHVSSATSAQV